MSLKKNYDKSFLFNFSAIIWTISKVSAKLERICLSLRRITSSPKIYIRAKFQICLSSRVAELPLLVYRRSVHPRINDSPVFRET